MRYFRSLSVCLFTGSLLYFAALASAEEVLFQSTFDTPESVNCYGRREGIEFDPSGGGNGAGCIKFSSAQVRDTILEIPLNVNKVRGRAIQLEGWLKAVNIAIPEPKYLGPKLMLNVQAPGENSFAEQDKIFGSHDWRKFKVFTQIPDDVEKITLVIGIQHSSGTLYMNNIKVDIIPLPDQEKFIHPISALQKVPRYRGAMSGFNLNAGDIQDFAEKFGGNLIRWQFLREKSDISTPEKYLSWLDEQIAKLDAVMPALQKYDIKVVVDLHSGPGMSQNALMNNALCWDLPNQALLVKGWEKISGHYRGNDRIYGYDLLNEPREDNYVYEPAGGLDWNRLAAITAAAVRAIDPETPIIIEPAKWANPAGFKIFRPINIPNIIYSVHFYEPHKYTHQGINNVSSNIQYPGMIDGEKWDRAKLRERLQPVIEFQRKYNVPVYVGEFSAIRWAPGAEQYLDDCIAIFEENGWDWTYHAFREWNGWSVEHSMDRNDNAPVAQDTDRKRVLLKWFANKRR